MEVVQVLLAVFRFYDDVKAFLALRKSYDDDQWFAEGAALTKAIKGCKSDEERRALVRRLADHQSNA